MERAFGGFLPGHEVSVDPGIPLPVWMIPAFVIVILVDYGTGRPVAEIGFEDDVGAYVGMPSQW